jgi:hypothetical protein
MSSSQSWRMDDNLSPTSKDIAIKFVSQATTTYVLPCFHALLKLLDYISKSICDI